MAAVISEPLSHRPSLHDMIAVQPTARHHRLQHSDDYDEPRRSHHDSASHRTSESRQSGASPTQEVPSTQRTPLPNVAENVADSTSQPRRPPRGASREDQHLRASVDGANAHHTTAAALTHDGASRIPSPPSSSPAVSAGSNTVADDAIKVPMASQTTSIANPSLTQHASLPTDGALPQQQQQQPSPPNEDVPMPNSASRLTPTPAAADQTVIHIRDLAHIQSLARADMLGGPSGAAANGGVLHDPPLQQMKYEISGMPIGDVIEMVAALLTKITTTNDLQHDAMQRNAMHQQQAGQAGEASGSSQMSPLSHSVLAFHGKNVPAITILNYLSRIHKYCPTTYEVFLSLLVYFDRMTERVNEMVTQSEASHHETAPHSEASRPASRAHAQDASMPDKPESLADSDESDSDLADDDDDDDDDDEMADSSAAHSRTGSDKGAKTASAPGNGAATYFVVDSFNIHRLIIAGVTCASKFFSDVFYTNSRYAKVGGLPLAELNHLELQFLVLNDFRLAVPVEDLEAYATMLVEFYARDVVAENARSRGSA